MIPNKKSSIVLVLKILEEFSDENHYLTQKEIGEKLYSLYGVEVERKSIASSLSLLMDLDYDINKGPKGGYALLSRAFDETEAQYLIDALFSSKSISAKKANEIAKNISNCFSKYQRKDYSYIYKSGELNRTTNENVLYNISIIHEAIKQGKRVGFNYLSYDINGNKTTKNDNYEYIVSPYYLINNFGRYYLLCNYREKYRPIQCYRVDYMLNIHIKDDWDIKPIESLKDLKEDFSITDYINSHMYMFNGEVIDAELEVLRLEDISQIKDWFGETAKIKTKDGKTIAYIKCDENALYYWIMQYSESVKVLSPIKFVERIKTGLKEALEKYE